MNGAKKDHPVMECLGTIDELNAFLGDAKTAVQDKSTAEIITTIQKNLSALMSVLAGTPIPADDTGESRLNTLIAELESQLPPLNSFVIPGENPASAKLHIARTVCRRAERRLVGLDCNRAIASYLNRLSKALFLLARKEAVNAP